MSGKYIWVQPSPGSALLPISGDISTNVGTFVSAILAHPEVSLPSRYVTVKTETLSFEEILKVWSKVTGKEAEYVEITFEAFTRLWGPYGEEMGMQYKFGAEFGDWDALQPDMVKMEELGIKRSELTGLEETLEMLKPILT
jgi:NmrA-like family